MEEITEEATELVARAGHRSRPELAGQWARLIGLYLESRELHFRLAVHESSRQRTAPQRGPISRYA